MKVLHIIKSLEKGGAERYVIDLCLELNKRKDIEYKLLVLQQGNDFEFLTKDIPFIQMDGPFIPSILKKTAFDSLPYRKIIEDFKPDIIHSHLFRSELYTSTHVVEDVAYVVHGHDNMREFRNFDLQTLRSKPLLTNFFEKRILKRKYRKNPRTYFIANSQDTLAYYRKSVPGHLASKVVLIEYGFDLARFYNPQREHKPVTEKLKLINIGRFAVYKNQKLLVEIGKILKERSIPFEMNLLGVGEKFEEIKHLVCDNGLEDSIFLRGNVNDVEKWLNEADIYVHSAYYEPFGLVLLEAMASGLPCVILNGKGNADIIDHGVNGYIFDEQDPALFADTIIHLMQDTGQRKKIAVNAQEYASRFAIGPKTDELIEFYRSIALRK